ncbi:hypothetical protein [Staphylococcus delphini]|uniref:hypothetical protein n=1 Tax=Staphylococcus delphini TaxID=53344 RepID=UPI0012D33713|nr:hypothetical protein [Staphylococcus delphini]MTV19175.1 hypothetical protein [Staphylococcus delphini]
MSNYSKLMKSFKNGVYHIEAFELSDLSQFGSYPNLMKEKYEKGFTQIIINSFLMIGIMEYLSKHEKWVLTGMEISDPSVDEETLMQIKTIFHKIRGNRNDFSLLKEYLFWALDEGSIFIDQISAYNLKESINIEINSNGLLYGNNNKIILDSVILPLLNRYLNE